MRATSLRNACCGLFALLVLFPGQALAVPENVTVDATSSQLQYVGTWVEQDGGGHKFTGEKGASVSLTFQGTAIYWYSDNDSRGAVGRVTIDGEDGVSVDLAANTTAGQTTTASACQYAKTGLDENKEHTIKIAFAGIGKNNGSYLSFYYFEYAPSTLSSSASTTASSTPSPTASASSGSGHSNTALIGGIVGGVVGGLLAAAVVFLFLFCRRRRRRAQQHQTAKANERTSRPYILPRAPSPGLTTDDKPSPPTSPGPTTASSERRSGPNTSSASGPRSARSEEASTLMSAMPMLQRPPPGHGHGAGAVVDEGGPRSLETVLDLSSAPQAGGALAPNRPGAVVAPVPAPAPAPAPAPVQEMQQRAPLSAKLAHSAPASNDAFITPALPPAAASVQSAGAADRPPRPWPESRPESTAPFEVPPPVYTERPS